MQENLDVIGGFLENFGVEGQRGLEVVLCHKLVDASFPGRFRLLGDRFFLFGEIRWRLVGFVRGRAERNVHCQAGQDDD